MSVRLGFYYSTSGPSHYIGWYMNDVGIPRLGKQEDEKTKASVRLESSSPYSLPTFPTYLLIKTAMKCKDDILMTF